MQTIENPFSNPQLNDGYMAVQVQISGYSAFA